MPPITPPTAMTVEEEREQLRTHRIRQQKTASDEPKPIGATILSLLPKLALEANSVTKTQQKGVEFQATVENSKACSTLEHNIATEVAEETQPKSINDESNQVLAERAERKAVWQGILHQVADSMGETYDPITCKMREVTLEDMQLQFDRAEYRIDLELKRIKLQAKSELWIPAFELSTLRSSKTLPLKQVMPSS